MLQILLKQLKDLFATQPYLLTMYTALFSTAYYGLFRVSEFTTGIVGSHLVRARDVHIAANKEKMKFVLRTSKTHWTDDKPQNITISSQKQDPFQRHSMPGGARGANMCPYQILREYLKCRPQKFLTADEPFFMFRDQSPGAPHNM